jgi:hypothetical protein
MSHYEEYLRLPGTQEDHHKMGLVVIAALADNADNLYVDGWETPDELVGVETLPQPLSEAIITLVQAKTNWAKMAFDRGLPAAGNELLQSFDQLPTPELLNLIDSLCALLGERSFIERLYEAAQFLFESRRQPIE